MNKVTEQNNPDLITLGGRIEHERRLKMYNTTFFS